MSRNDINDEIKKRKKNAPPNGFGLTDPSNPFGVTRFKPNRFGGKSPARAAQERTHNGQASMKGKKENG